MSIRWKIPKQLNGNTSLSIEEHNKNNNAIA